MPARKKLVSNQMEELTESDVHSNKPDTTVPLCECKAQRGKKFYENYQTWLPRPGPEWSDLSQEQKMAYCMASNGKRND